MAAPNRGSATPVGSAGGRPPGGTPPPRPPATAQSASRPAPKHDGPTSLAGDPLHPLAEQIFQEPWLFDFFQAVRLMGFLERHPQSKRHLVGGDAVRFTAHLSFSFPASSIYDLLPAKGKGDSPEMVVAFLGLHGPSGVLPRVYNEMLLNLERRSKETERGALRDWFDLYNHRLIDLFYRAWEKYRFYVPYERGDYDLPEADVFTRMLFSLVGMGTGQLTGRMRVAEWLPKPDVVNDSFDVDHHEAHHRERTLSQIDDLAILHYAGHFARHDRTAYGLSIILEDYFQTPVRLKQFQGQWLVFEQEDQSRLGMLGANSVLGRNIVVGQRAWDVQGKIRIRVGPLNYSQFVEFLPDRATVPARKAFFTLSHLVRLYIGPAIDFDVQVVLKANSVPGCRLDSKSIVGARLGWNTWALGRPLTRDAEDVVFQGADVVWVNEREATEESEDDE